MGQLSIRIDLQVPSWPTLEAVQVEEICFAQGALSVVLTDQHDDAILEPAPGELRLWPSTRLQALFATDSLDAGGLISLTTTLAAALGCPLERLQVEHLADRAWEREWLRDFKPMRFGERLWIAPHHAADELQASPAGREAVIVRLDPGLAFGTGTHPTTRLCLEYLDQIYSTTNDRIPRTVLDYGCGSGVLAIAALKLGAARAYAFDTDPQALVASADNAADNGVAAQLVLESAPQGAADLVLANILAGPLCELAPTLLAAMHEHATLVLAGLLEEQADEVIAAYAPALQLSRWGTREGWTCLAGSR